MRNSICAVIYKKGREEEVRAGIARPSTVIRFLKRHRLYLKDFEIWWHDDIGGRVIRDSGLSFLSRDWSWFRSRYNPRRKKRRQRYA